MNMLSPGQVMNTSFNPLQIVEYVRRVRQHHAERYEIVIEGTDDDAGQRPTVWREYEFKGKPGDPARRPPQIAPYHLRLDWLMWFAAMGPCGGTTVVLAADRQAAAGGPATFGLLRTIRFPNARRDGSVRSCIATRSRPPRSGERPAAGTAARLGRIFASR